MAKLAEKSARVLEYLQQHDNGNGVAISEIADALGLDVKSVRPTVSLSLAKAPKDGSREILATYEKRQVEGEEKTVGYAVLTEAGRNYTEDAE